RRRRRRPGRGGGRRQRGRGRQGSGAQGGAHSRSIGRDPQRTLRGCPGEAGNSGRRTPRELPETTQAGRRRGSEPRAMRDTVLTFETPASGPAATGPADVEIVISVYNEEADLERSVRRLQGYLTERFPLSWRITIADNASLDATWGIACRLARDVPGVRAARLPRKGRGGALRAIWSASLSPVVAYMDVDLSTDLDALLPLVAPLVSGHSDVAIGTRLARASRVERGPKREVISRAYNLILKAVLRNRFSDAQCGFKAVRGDVARALLPLVEDDGWFFDTELLVLAEHNGLRIHEVAVDWVDDPDSRVDIASTARDDLKGLWHLRRRLARGEGRLSEAAGVTIGPRPPSRLRKLIRYATVSVISSALSMTVLGVLVLTGA